MKTKQPAISGSDRSMEQPSADESLPRQSVAEKLKETGEVYDLSNLGELWSRLFDDEVKREISENAR